MEKRKIVIDASMLLCSLVAGVGVGCEEGWASVCSWFDCQVCG